MKEYYPDHTAFDESHPYYDPKSTDQSKPKWYMVDVEYVRHLKRFISLKELQRDESQSIRNMVLFRQSRLSVQPVSKKEYEYILKLENKREEDHEAEGEGEFEKLGGNGNRGEDQQD